MKKKTSNKGKVGHPILITQQKLDLIFEALAAAMPIDLACDYACVARTSFFEYQQKGKRDIENNEHETPYAQFYYTIQRAKAQKTLQLLRDVEEGKKNWTAKAWLLERTRAKHFSKDALMLQQNDELKQFIAELSKKKEANNEK